MPGVESRSGVRVFKNYSFLASSYAVSRLLTFLVLVYIARRLGVQVFGQINFALAILTYSTLLTHLGLMTFGTREVARHPQQIRSQVTSILLLRMVLTLVAFLALVGFAYLAPFEPALRALILIFGLSLFPTAALLDWAFKGVERMNIVGIIEIIRAIPHLVLIVIWVRSPAQVFRIPIFYFLSTLLAVVLGLFLFCRDYGSLQSRIDVRSWKRAMKESLPLGMAFILLQVYYLTDTIMLGFLRGSVFVGWYSAAYKSVAFVLVVGGLFFETTFPVVSRYYKQARERLPWLLNSSVRVTALLATPMAVGGTILASPFLAALYGSEYRAAVIAFRLLIWAVAIELMGMNWGYALMACDRAKEYMKAVGFGAVLSVALNLALIPKFGLLGAGLARLISSITISAYFWLQFRRVFVFAWSRYLLKPALASGLMATTMVLVAHSWIFQMGIGLLVYVSTILIIGPSEREQVLLIAKSILAPTQTITAQNSVSETESKRLSEETHQMEIVES